MPQCGQMPSHHALSSTIRIHVTTPDHLVVGIPYLLGFVPANSAVLVWTDEDVVILTMRVDLPLDGEADDRDAWARGVLAAARHSGSRHVHIAVFTDLPPDPAGLAVDALVEAAGRLGIEVITACTVAHERMYVDACSICPASTCSGHSIAEDAAGAAVFREHFPTPAPSRDAVLEEFCGAATSPELAPLIASQVRSLADLGRTPEGHAAMEDWRDEAIAAILRDCAQETGPLTDDPAEWCAHIARAVVAMGDTRCRDAVLWAMTEEGRDLRQASLFMASVARQAPVGMAAGPASVLAVIMWLSGDGLRASAACRRALQCDPDYSLAVLLDAALSAGLPPRVWRQVVSELTFDECRGRPVPEPSSESSRPARTAL